MNNREMNVVRGHMDDSVGLFFTTVPCFFFFFFFTPITLFFIIIFLKFSQGRLLINCSF